MLDYVESVLELAAEQLAEVERLHAECLQTGVATGRMKALIKNVVENQRSVLDYTAQAVADKYLRNKNPYWPDGRYPADFKKRMSKQLPGILTKQPAVAASFERHQRYQPGHGWVPHLFKLTRINKHHGLSPQTREQGTLPQIDVQLARSRRGGRAKRLRSPIIFVRWDFVDPKVPVLDTLREIQTGVRQAAADVYSSAGGL